MNASNDVCFELTFFRCVYIDEYKNEKRINEIYVQRYKKHLEEKKKLYSMQLPQDDAAKSDVINYCESTDDMPTKIATGDPYKKESHQCIFCKYNLPIDYKNVQLLSQFVSPYTGTCSLFIFVFKLFWIVKQLYI